LLVPAVALIELAAQWIIEARVPTPDHWRAAHAHIARSRREGDLVTSAPLWTDPLARMHLGDLIALRDAARPDATRYTRAWVVSAYNHEHPDLVGWRTRTSTSFGRLTVHLMENPTPARVLYDFVDHVRTPDATVARNDSGALRECEFRAGFPVLGGGLGQGALAGPERYQCSHESWNYVGVTVIEDMQHRARRCIWSHPVQGALMTTTFHDVPLGTKIYGHHGLAYEAERGDDNGNDLGGPVVLRVLVDDTPLDTSVHRDGDGWKPFEFNTTPWAGSRHRVSFEVRSDRPGMRHYCFEGDAR
jgi:hypothetical protein